ncbi:trimethylamine methyltransferase family protein [Rhizobiales bacterium]|uniref:trimethylamine methyltransferase family protein n=1 Tax=Hongsoonwoonella zoysiae TaxID=2821844 RepID=UPI00155FA214|nr:trimethylamine methyltransferase family protein [Hongsoonwoonella zoysiae]NRG17019.1 trimethylamine methyltransferase family protein [Hongsoonwoonella zoysiae]
MPSLKLAEGGTRPKKSARERRKERRATTVHAAPAYITRQIPPYEILGEESLLRIEAAADRILAEVGIEFRGDDVALDLFRKAGAKADGVRCMFEPGMLREILKTAPREFVQHARNPSRSVKIGGPHVVFAPSYGSPFVMDLDRGRRYGTIEDFRNFVKLAYAAPWLHHSGGTVCEPTDVPVNKRHLDMVYAHLRYSDKSFLGSITAPERAEDSIEMARIVFGPEFVEENCVVMGNVNVNSPLVWDGTMTGAIRAYAAANQGSVIVPFILGGAMGPVTSAGAIAQSLAETMVGCALTQLVRPGAPVIFGNFLSSMALRSGSPTFGTPEPAAGSLVVGQLARRLGLPLRCAGSFTTSKLPDAQAMQESVTSMLSAVHCGANFLLHSAGFLDGLLSMSYEKFVMDVDYCGALHTYLAGVPVDDNSLALDAFAEVGPGNHFFGASHTMRNYETAFWDTDLSDNDPFETWDENGGLDMASRANARWKKVLNAYEAPPIDPGVDQALQEFIACRKAEMPDAWY